MPTTLADAYVRLRPLIKDFVRDASAEFTGPATQAGQEAGKNFGSGFGTAVKAAVVGAAVAAGLAAKGLAVAVGKASDLAETQSKVNVVFGKGAPAIQEWAGKAANALGQSNQTALDGAATFALYGKAAGKTGADLVKFSTSMATLASDVGSFNNADPAQVIADFGSAMRGEFDPIEKYGVLLNETVVKNEALKLGLIKTTTAALTPQQRVLAVQAAILKQTGDAQGDFARTSGGLANQQRILKANFENLSASVGQSLLPVVTKFVTMLNAKAIPALQELWRVHGPKVTAWLTSAGEWVGKLIDKFSGGGGFDGIKKSVGDFGDTLSKVDWRELWGTIVEGLKSLKDNGAGVGETLSVASVVIGFLADHMDLLAEYLPLIVAGWVAYKIAQAAANVVALAQVPIQAAQAASMFGMRGAMAANTAALNANTLALGGNVPAQNAGIIARIRAAASWVWLQITTAAATVRTWANTAATWLSTQAQAAWTAITSASIVASIRASAAAVWARVVTIAGTAATWLATAATWALGAAMTFVAGPIGIIILVVAALVAGIIYAYKHNETFRNIVQAVWTFIKDFIKGAWENVIKPVWDAIVWFVMNAIVPAFKWLWQIVKETWNGLAGFISGAWNNVIKPVFNFLKTFIMETIPNAFRSGIDIIKGVWDRMKDIAKTPIRFVVETVINEGIIGIFNKVADFLHLPSSIRIPKVPLPAGFAAGGRIPGAPSDVDNMFGRGPNGLIALATGEYIVNAKATKNALPLLEWINRGTPGFAGGGLLDFLSGPIDWVKGKLSSPINSIAERFGSNGFAQLGLGVANRVKDGVITRVQDLLGSADVGGGGGSVGGLQAGILAVLAGLRALFGNVSVISGFRKNSTTLTGNRSYHADGRAIDVAPVLSWARFLNAAFGKRLRELITPWNDLNIHNGAPHRYSGAVWNQHNFPGGNAHIHAAMANGGRIFDTGGAWPSGTVGFNTSGRTEQVFNGDAVDRMLDLLAAILLALRGLAPDIAASLDDAGAPLRRMSRTGALAWPS